MINSTDWYLNIIIRVFRSTENKILINKQILIFYYELFFIELVENEKYCIIYFQYNNNESNTNVEIILLIYLCEIAFTFILLDNASFILCILKDVNYVMSWETQCDMYMDLYVVDSFSDMTHRLEDVPWLGRRTWTFPLHRFLPPSFVIRVSVQRNLIAARGLWGRSG